MKSLKSFERWGKRIIRDCIRLLPGIGRISPADVDISSISRILVVRQDARLGNLILLTPLLSALREAFPDAEIDVLVSEGFESILSGNPNITRLLLFKKHSMKVMPWNYLFLLRRLKSRAYDLAIDVSNGYHFSLNGALLTRFSGARYRMGYDRGDASSYFNVLTPLPQPDTHMADAIRDIVRPILPGMSEYHTTLYVNEEDRAYAAVWLSEREITEYDPFFVIHPGGKGKKRWGSVHFANLADRISGLTGARVVVAGGGADSEAIREMRTLSRYGFETLEGMTVCQMAAVIERCEMFISGDTGPMHVATALGRPVVAIFLSSNPKVYGPRGKYSRIVTGIQSVVTVDDVMNAVWDILSIDSDMEK